MCVLWYRAPQRHEKRGHLIRSAMYMVHCGMCVCVFIWAYCCLFCFVYADTRSEAVLMYFACMCFLVHICLWFMYIQTHMNTYTHTYLHTYIHAGHVCRFLISSPSRLCVNLYACILARVSLCQARTRVLVYWAHVCYATSICARKNMFVCSFFLLRVCMLFVCMLGFNHNLLVCICMYLCMY